jgi:hypothetical protein
MQRQGGHEAVSVTDDRRREEQHRAARALVEHLRALAAEASSHCDRYAEVAISVVADAVEAGAVPRLLASHFDAWPDPDGDPPGVVARAVRALKGA